MEAERGASICKPFGIELVSSLDPYFTDKEAPKADPV
jgi:hypothetical protein